MMTKKNQNNDIPEKPAHGESTPAPAPDVSDDILFFDAADELYDEWLPAANGGKTRD